MILCSLSIDTIDACMIVRNIAGFVRPQFSYT